MGNCSSSSSRDAYGNWLEEGSWVECTNEQGQSTGANSGRVKFIHDDRTTFEWPVFGNYHYTEDDIRRWGLRKILADKDGRKLKVDQLVEMRDGSEGIVSSVSDSSVTVNFTSKDWLAGSRSFGQRDIEAAGVKICASLGRNRKCTDGACM